MSVTPPDSMNPTSDMLARGYAPLSTCRDEMTGDSASLRPHWQPFLRALDALGLGELTRRWEEARHLIRENGVTYNIYGDPRGLDRPWQLDPIPLVFPQAEWQSLEAGLIQRAQLLERVLADLYGPQRVLHEGLLPPELVLAHPGFLRPCHGLSLPCQRHLHLYAADLGRSSDGQMCVLGDRTQAPSGAGYALENRIILTRMLPDVFRDCQVQRLAMFFRALRETLRQLAPSQADNPRVVLLTPGPYNETYFEHAFLARYLGYPLVEGADLTVRDNRVFLKLLGGLQPVDVILRRLDDDFCDPLELRGDSSLGVPGLLQAVRAGQVAVANPLGSGVVETPALLPYLPALCRHLLGEELRLPSVPTWWCGDRTAQSHVLANLHRLVIKKAFPSPAREKFFGEQLSSAEREQLANAIRARPWSFVGQEQLALSTTPVWIRDRLEPRHMVLRTYLTASEGSFLVIPGGLTRVSASADTLVVSMQKGGGSKDTWVLASGPVSTFSLLRPPDQPVALSRAGGDLPSRVADNLFWLGRQAERAEGLVRLLRAVLVRLTERVGLADAPELPGLFEALRLPHSQGHPGNEVGAESGNGVADAWTAGTERNFVTLIFDGWRQDSLSANVAALRRAAGRVRDRLSADTWRILHSLDLLAAEGRAQACPAGELCHPVADAKANSDLGAAPAPLTPGDLLALLNEMVASLAALGGMVMESMTRGQGWRFLDMGRRLERTLYTVRLLRDTLVRANTNETPLLEALLEIADCSITYRRRYLAGLQAAPVLDLLLADETNPRSVAFQLVALSDHVQHLPGASAGPAPNGEHHLTRAALDRLRQADLDHLCQVRATGDRPGLSELLSGLEGELPSLNDILTRQYFSHLAPRRQGAGHGP